MGTRLHRDIEIKAAAITQGQMALRLGDQYRNCVVEDIPTEPRLTPIQDPVHALPSPREVVDVVKAVIKDWRRQADG